MGKKRLCVFCGKLAATHEHFIPQWLDDIFPALDPGDVGRLLIEKGIPELSESVQRSESEIARTAAVEVPGFCHSCNGGWMSQLESRVKPIAVPMINGDATTGLSVGDQVELATWFAKFAVVQEAMTPSVSATTTPDERAIIATQLRPPVSFAVRIGRYSGDWRWLAWRQVGGLDPNEPQETRFSCSTFVIGNLVGQVVINPSRAKGNPLVVPGVVFEDSISIYPPVRQMPWPPKLTIEEHTLNGFVRSLIEPIGGEFPLGPAPGGPP